MARRTRSSKDKKKVKPQKAKAKEPDTKIKEGLEPTEETVERTELPTREERKNRLRDWYNDNRYTILILLGIFALAFFMRFYFYYEISFDTWPPRVVGNDPSYHKRVIDFVQSDLTHIRIDELLNYPLAGGNPRPPIFDWSIAIVGILISPFFGFNVENSTWFVFQMAPSVWGALTVFPLYLLGKEAFGRKAGIMAAFFLAITAAHLERSTLGFTDHDSFVVFLLVLSLFFLSKSFNVLKDRNFVEDWRRSDSVVLGFRSFFRENKEAVAYAGLTGLSIAAISLTWAGYAYVLAILLVYYMVQLLINRFRNEDSLGIFMILMIVMGAVVTLSLPYYFRFSIATWSQGFYIFLAMVILGTFIVPTRDMPWLIVIPTLAALIGASYFALRWGFPETADLLFTGGGYFISNKLYDTIAEAQAPDISRVVFTYGPGTFFLGLVGIVMAFIKIPKHMKKDYMVIVIWTGVAIYMAFSATRFTFNATPAFALLAGWTLVELVRFFKAEGLSIVYSIGAVLLFLFLLGSVKEGWDGFFFDNFIVLTILPIVGVSLAVTAYMKYKKHRDNFKFRTILTALTVSFLIIFPNLFFAVDAAIPYERKTEFDPDMEFFGAFGSSLHSEYWTDSYNWLAQQDLIDEDGNYIEPEDRPGFMSWWDYGFDQLVMGKHPTAADNFQNGYHFTGSMIACQNESESIALMCARLIEGDWKKSGWKMSDEVFDVLVDHLGKDENSSYSAYEIKRIYKNPSDYTEIVEGDPGRYGNYISITPQNAKYAAARGVLVRLGEEGLVDLYHDLREVTGFSLRYFAVDYRLFPFSASNTGIFYAPIKLADRDIDDYLEYKAYAQQNLEGSNEDPVWEDYPDNPISMDKVKEESERLGYKFRVVDYDMFYTDDFYNSMFYRTYIGYAPEDVGAVNDGKSIPGIMGGDVSNLPAMQGWNMTHWKLVYRTMYYSDRDEANASYPDDYRPISSKKALELYREKGGDLKSGLGQGVFYLKYHDGAILSGRVRTERGVGVPDVRVTVLDDYGIPHGNVMTGPDGSYSLILPPGEVNVIVTSGELNNQYDKLYQFQVDQSTGQPTTLLNSTKMDISDALAMREVDGGRIEKDLLVSGKRMSGKVYWDINGDGSYKEADDELIRSGSISYLLKGSDGVRYGPAELTESGTYSISDVVTGRYDVEYQYGDWSEAIITDLNIDPKTESTKDVRIENTMVGGNISYGYSTPAVGEKVILESQSGDVYESVSDINGNYSFEKVLPGIYELYAGNEEYIHGQLPLSIGQGDNQTIDIFLEKRATLSVNARLPISSDPGSGTGHPAAGARLRLIPPNNLSRLWILTLDDTGRQEVDVPEGFYDIEITSKERSNIRTHSERVWLGSSLDNKLDTTLERGYLVTGLLTKLSDTPMENTPLFFRSKDGSIYVTAWTNNMGIYNAYLPEGKAFEVLVNNATETGNVSYYHLQDVPEPEGHSQVELDIWTEKTVQVSGMLYWDKDMNGIFTPQQEAIETNDEGGKVASEIAIKDVTISFTFSNGTITTVTGDEGLYSVLLPPKEYTMEVDIPGFVPYSRKLTVEDSVKNYNFGLNGTDVILHSERSELEVNVSYPLLGTLGEREGLADLRLELVAEERYMEKKTYDLLTDGQGKAYALVPPGQYLIHYEDTYTLKGCEYDLLIDHSFFLQPGGGVWTEEVEANSTVTFTGSAFEVIDTSTMYPPGEAEVEFFPLHGARAPVANTITDYDGEFEITLPLGSYIVQISHYRFGLHYHYWDAVEVKEGMEPPRFRLDVVRTVKGNLVEPFEDIDESFLFLTRGDLWKMVEVSSGGTFQFEVFDGEYNVEYHYEMLEKMMGEETLIIYNGSRVIDVDSDIDELEIPIDKWIGIRGSVYVDRDQDGSIDENERLAGANLTLVPRNSEDGQAVNITTGPDGRFDQLVRYAPYNVTVNMDDYRERPDEGSTVIDIPSFNQVEWDVELLPRESRVSGTVFNDNVDDGLFGYGDQGVAGMRLIFDKLGERTTAYTQEDGSFSLSLEPGSYQIQGMKYIDGLPVMGYLGAITVTIGEDIIEMEWEARPAERFRGTAYFKDTDGTLYTDLAGQEPITFRTSGGSELEAELDRGTFVIDLPYYTYTVTSYLSNEEYGVTVDYRISRTLDIGEDTTPEDMSLRFEKESDYSFDLDLVNFEEHQIEMRPGETRRLMYYLENLGNEPYSVDLSTKEVPDGWTVEFPDGQGIPLGFREVKERYVTRQINITAPKSPAWVNSIRIEGASEEGSKNTFEINIKTPPSYKFELKMDVPDVVGSGFGQTTVINLTVNNLGTGEDVVNLMLSPTDDEVEEWEILFNGEKDFPPEGENASMTPQGERKYSITVKAPDPETGSIGDSVKVTVTGKNRRGDVETVSRVIRITRPNLVLPTGYLKLVNRKLTDETMKNDIDANITVKSLYRDSANVNVTLTIDGRVIGSSVIPYIPQGGIGNTRIRFNISEHNISRDRFHTFEVFVDPENRIEEVDEDDNGGIWTNVLIGNAEEDIDINWRIVIFFVLVVLVSIAIIAYRQKNQPI